MCRLSRNLGASTSWNPQGLSRPVMGLVYLLPFTLLLLLLLLLFICTELNNLKISFTKTFKNVSSQSELCAQTNWKCRLTLTWSPTPRTVNLTQPKQQQQFSPSCHGSELTLASSRSLHFHGGWKTTANRSHLRQECHNSKFGIFELLVLKKRDVCRCTF